jgi:hypothetical protein
MHTLNFSTHAIEDLVHYGFEFAGGTPPALRQAMRDLCTEVAGLLARADKFLLPTWGRIFDADEWQVVAEVPVLPRLPYPVVAAEYVANYAIADSVMPGQERSSKRIILMVECEHMTTPQLSAAAGAMFSRWGAGFAMLPVSYSDRLGAWIPPPSGLYFPRDSALRDYGHAFMTCVGTQAYAHHPEASRQWELAIHDSADEAICTTHLLTALSMEKASYTTIPAPAKLNAKRARSGKPSISEYKVLDIVADVSASPRQHAGRPPGTHASPRLHKRRGHVRRLGTGRVTWIRSAIVGKPGHGAVTKSYHVHHEEHRHVSP